MLRKRINKNKTIFCDDTITAANILSSNTPEDVLRLGQSVKNFNEEAWKVDRYKIMVDILRQKFTQNDELRDILMKTGKRKLAESGSNKFVSYQSVNGLVKTSWVMHLWI